MDDSYERIILTGGYGGFLLDDPRSDGGFHTFNDVWTTTDGCQTWILLNGNAGFSERSWHGVSVLNSLNDTKVDASAQRPDKPPRIFLFGGGSIGYSGDSSKRTTTMTGLLDGYSTVDGIEWTKLSYEEGGGSTTVTQFSTQEWAIGSINSAAVYIGRWGHTLLQFSPQSLLTSSSFNYLFLIGGQMAGGGGMSDAVFQSSGGLFCDIEGIGCNYQ